MKSSTEYLMMLLKQLLVISAQIVLMVKTGFNQFAVMVVAVMLILSIGAYYISNWEIKVMGN